MEVVAFVGAALLEAAVAPVEEDAGTAEAASAVQRKRRSRPAKSIFEGLTDDQGVMASRTWEWQVCVPGTLESQPVLHRCVGMPESPRSPS